MSILNSIACFKHFRKTPHIKRNAVYLRVTQCLLI